MKITLMSLIAVLALSTTSAFASTGAAKFMENLSETKELNIEGNECSLNLSLFGMPSDPEGTKPYAIAGRVTKNSEKGNLYLNASSRIDALEVSNNKVEINQYVSAFHKSSITITVDLEGNPIKVASSSRMPKLGSWKINCDL